MNLTQNDVKTTDFDGLAEMSRHALPASRISREDSARARQKVLDILGQDHAVPFGGGRHFHASFLRRAITGQTFSGSTALAAAIVLRMAEEVIVDEKMGNDSLDVSETSTIQDKKRFAAFSRLPLFFPGSVMDEWATRGWRKAVDSVALAAADREKLVDEAEQMAQGWSVNRDSLGINQMIEDDDTPRHKAWIAWYRQVSMETLQSILTFSAQIFASLIEEKTLVSPAFPVQNAAFVGNRLGISAEEQRVWGLWLCWSQAADTWFFQKSVERVGEWCDEHLSGQKVLWNMFERAIGASDDVLASLFQVASPLVKAGLMSERAGHQALEPYSTSVSVSKMTSWVNGSSHKLYNEAASPDHLIGRFVQRVSTPKALARVMAQKNAPKPTVEAGHEESSFVGSMDDVASDDGIWSIADFPWADKEASSSLIALKSGRPVKILLWGDPGVGKTELSQALAKEAGLMLCAPAPPSSWDHKNKDTDMGALRLEAVSAADRMVPGLGHCAILVDECEVILKGDDRKARIIECLEAGEAPQIWIANTLNDIHPATLRRFDFIARIEPMPLNAREELATKMFPTPSLAQRAAQSLKTPAELAQARDWCATTGIWTWENISLLLSGRQKATAAIDKSKKHLGHGGVQVIVPNHHGEGLNLVAGYANVKQDARDLIQFLEEPDVYKTMGAIAPRGTLLAGAPGCGKTLLVRAIAQEAMTPLLMMSSSDLARDIDQIGELFTEARRRAPCIVFIDEIDVLIGDVRNAQGVPDLAKQTILNRLLTEMDGFEVLDGVVVIGATHNLDRLDAAALRSGRFGNTIEFREPTSQDRMDILQHALGKVKTSGDFQWEGLSLASAGFSGADLTQAVNEAALAAARERADGVTHQHLNQALDHLAWGSPNGTAMNEETLQRVCVHESGHALLTLAAGLRVQRMTVRPRKSFWGAVWPKGEDGDGVFSLQQVKDRIALDLAGLVAETLIYGRVDSGASSDLASASSYAHKAITKWGMSPNLGLSGIDEAGSRAHSETLLARIEAERATMLEAGRQQATEFLTHHRGLLLDMASWIMIKRDANWGEVQAWVAQWMSQHPDAAPLRAQASNDEHLNRWPLTPVVGLRKPLVIDTHGTATQAPWQQVASEVKPNQ